MTRQQKTHTKRSGSAAAYLPHQRRHALTAVRAGSCSHGLAGWSPVSGPWCAGVFMPVGVHRLGSAVSGPWCAGIFRPGSVHRWVTGFGAIVRRHCWTWTHQGSREKADGRCPWRAGVFEPGVCRHRQCFLSGCIGCPSVNLTPGSETRARLRSRDGAVRCAGHGFDDVADGDGSGD